MSDADLVARCRDGDAAAWDELYRRHAPTAARFLRCLVGPHPEVEDLVHQVFLEVLQSAPTWRMEGRFTSWLYGVTAHVAGTWARGEARRRRRDGDWTECLALARGPGGDPAREAADRELLRVVARALDGLGMKERSAWVLAEVEGLTPDEAGRALGVPAVTVRMRLHRARRHVREVLLREGA